MQAVAAAATGIIVVDASGTELVRSGPAERFRNARHGDAVAQELVDRLLRSALNGTAASEEIALFGPPREALVVHAQPLRAADGTVIGAVADVEDITEVRRVESVRRDFVANVSHELKTPIGAMGLLAETFLACDDPEVGKRLAQQLVREADRLANIVDDLLDLSQVEAQEEPIREPVKARVLVNEAIERVQALALARNIPLRVGEVPDELVITCDSAQVVGAITNLLDNAIKYSDAGQAIEVSGAAADGRFAVTIADHGIGIPSRDLERIFERFYRVDKARSRATGGTGLGLAIVRHVAQAHGGEVTVTSTEGEGSTFRFVLPLVGPVPTYVVAAAEVE